MLSRRRQRRRLRRFGVACEHAVAKKWGRKFGAATACVPALSLPCVFHSEWRLYVVFFPLSLAARPLHSVLSYERFSPHLACAGSCHAVGSVCSAVRSLSFVSGLGHSPGEASECRSAFVTGEVFLCFLRCLLDEQTRVLGFPLRIFSMTQSPGSECNFVARVAVVRLPHTRQGRDRNGRLTRKCISFLNELHSFGSFVETPTASAA